MLEMIHVFAAQVAAVRFLRVCAACGLKATFVAVGWPADVSFIFDGVPLATVGPITVK